MILSITIAPHYTDVYEVEEVATVMCTVLGASFYGKTTYWTLDGFISPFAEFDNNELNFVALAQGKDKEFILQCWSKEKYFVVLNEFLTVKVIDKFPLPSQPYGGDV